MKKKRRYGIWNVLADFQSVRATADSLDFIFIDLEHGYRDYGDLVSCILESRLNNLETYIRLRNANDPMLQTLVDLGISNFVLPQIRSAEELDQFSIRVLEQPKGRRGVHPRSSFGLSVQGASPKVCVIIETKESLEAFVDIIEHPTVDEIYLGTYDLSADLGLPQGANSPELTKILGPVVEYANILKKPVIAMNASQTLNKAWLEMGISSIVIGIDSELIKSSLNLELAKFQKP